MDIFFKMLLSRLLKRFLKVNSFWLFLILFFVGLAVAFIRSFIFLKVDIISWVGVVIAFIGLIGFTIASMKREDG